jgi:hypothetical protein
VDPDAPSLRLASAETRRGDRDKPGHDKMLKHGLVVYDALYTWCRKAQAGP